MKLRRICTQRQIICHSQKKLHNLRTQKFQSKFITLTYNLPFYTTFSILALNLHLLKKSLSSVSDERQGLTNTLNKNRKDKRKSCLILTNFSSTNLLLSSSKTFITYTLLMFKPCFSYSMNEISEQARQNVLMETLMKNYPHRFN